MVAFSHQRQFVDNLSQGAGELGPLGTKYGECYMKSKIEMSIENFIRTVFLHDLKVMIYDANLHYLGFGTISSGIEFLGACIDDHPFSKPGESKKRFKLGIDHFMSKIDSKYSQFNQESSPYYLYKYLRCGMAHIIRPNGQVHFASRNRTNRNNIHLSIIGEILVLVCEDFYDHFAQSCKMLINELPSLSKPKLEAPYLTVINHKKI